jgi:hypothetical protein
MGMNRRTIRALAATTMLTTATGSIGCGYLLHPERRGAQSGRIDSETMVMDLLWCLLILPGIVALIVDFSSGAIYVRGGTALRLPPDGHVAVRLPRSSTPTRLAFRLVTASHRVIAEKTALIGPSSPDGQSIDLEVGGATRSNARQGSASASEAIFLEVRTESGASARFPTPMEVALGG